MHPSIMQKQSFITQVTCSGSIFSLMAVKPEMSANITVAILRSDSMDVLFSTTDFPSYKKKDLSGCHENL
jgi:hypothetical protein